MPKKISPEGQPDQSSEPESTQRLEPTILQADLEKMMNSIAELRARKLTKGRLQLFLGRAPIWDQLPLDQDELSPARKLKPWFIELIKNTTAEEFYTFLSFVVLEGASPDVMVAIHSLVRELAGIDASQKD